MGKEYKTLINKALERFYFRLSASGAHAKLYSLMTRNVPYLTHRVTGQRGRNGN